MFVTRIITASLLVSIFILVVNYGGKFGMLGLVSLVSGITAWEWTRINSAKIAKLPVFSGLFVVGAVLSLLLLPQLTYVSAYLPFLSVGWLFLLPWALGLFKDLRRWFGLAELALVVLGVSLIQLHAVSFSFLLSVMILVWIADSFAYFSGKLFGKHKMVPKISPGKTWEGLAGGVVATLIYAFVSGFYWSGSFFYELMHFGKFGVVWVAGACILLTALSVAGDLFESMLKRQAGVKDSSHLLPGHGGFFDRIDALIPVLPIAFVFHQLTKFI